MGLAEVWQELRLTTFDEKLDRLTSQEGVVFGENGKGRCLPVPIIDQGERSTLLVDVAILRKLRLLPEEIMHVEFRDGTPCLWFLSYDVDTKPVGHIVLQDTTLDNQVVAALPSRQWLQQRAYEMSGGPSWFQVMFVYGYAVFTLLRGKLR